MNLKYRLKNLEDNVTQDLYKICFTNGTTQYLDGLELLKMAIGIAQEKTNEASLTILTIERVNPDDNPSFVNLVKAVMEIRNG